MEKPHSPADPPGGHRKLRPSGGYRELRSFQVATLIYDGTVSFCERFIDKHSRTHDQMVQAARSGRQNIAEGNRAGATSSKSELHLTNVARGNLEELLLDCEDFLRQRKLPQWAKDSAEAGQVRCMGKTDRPDLADPSDAGDRARWAHYAPWLEHADPAVVANSLLCLIHQANWLLDRQLVSLEQEFIQSGGYSEQLAAARIAERTKQRAKQRTDPTDPTDGTDRDFPACPQCGKVMALRTARQGPGRDHNSGDAPGIRSARERRRASDRIETRSETLRRRPGARCASHHGDACANHAVSNKPLP